MSAAAAFVLLSRVATEHDVTDMRTANPRQHATDMIGPTFVLLRCHQLVSDVTLSHHDITWQHLDGPGVALALNTLLITACRLLKVILAEGPQSSSSSSMSELFIGRSRSSSNRSSRRSNDAAVERCHRPGSMKMHFGVDGSGKECSCGCLQV